MTKPNKPNKDFTKEQLEVLKPEIEKILLKYFEVRVKEIIVKL